MTDQYTQRSLRRTAINPHSTAQATEMSSEITSSDWDCANNCSSDTMIQTPLVADRIICRGDTARQLTPIDFLLWQTIAKAADLGCKAIGPQPVALTVWA